jgi:phosphatidylserine/phosphatidylglycerophosphate/cardiolipin synthase-like enzyme
VSTSATGVIDDGHGNGLKDVLVVLDDVTELHERELGHTTTSATGAFSFSYSEDIHVGEPLPTRRLRLRVRFGRHVLKEVTKTDVSGSQLAFETIHLTQADVTSRLATLGGAEASRVTHDNAITWLCDNEDGWAAVANVIRGATRSLDIMQLQIELKPFKHDPRDEQPQLVLDFHPQDLTAGHHRPVSAADDRIERLILAAGSTVAVHIQIPWPTLDKHAIPAATLGLLGLALDGALAAGAIVKGAQSSDAASFYFFEVAGFALLTVFVVAAPSAARLTYNLLRHGLFKEDEVEQWFRDAGATNVKVSPFHSQIFSVTHAKIVIADGEHAVLLGSPFEQVYYDAPAHLIEDPRRGDDAGKGPIHDVSIGVRGPAVGDLREVFNLHWNLADPTDPLPMPPPPLAPPAVTGAGPAEHLASVQVVRTLNPATFPKPAEGEKGVLESYLRAIHRAQRFIYFENQYFTNDTITEALIDALKANTKLQVILLLNVEPDMPFYPHWQRSAIKRIADAIPDSSKRFAAFTPWTHAAPDAQHPKPRLRTNYLHTKTGIIDNNWASVGSANLDGASLDYFQIAHPLQLGDWVNTETNCVVFGEGSGSEPAVDALRRQLWAEHLGFRKDGTLDTANTDLDDVDGRDWVETWSKQATAKQKGLHADANNVLDMHVLPWPLDSWFVNPKKHLEHLGLTVSNFDLVERGPRSFDFKRGFSLGRP